MAAEPVDNEPRIVRTGVDDQVMRLVVDEDGDGVVGTQAAEETEWWTPF